MPIQSHSWQRIKCKSHAWLIPILLHYSPRAMNAFLQKLAPNALESELETFRAIETDHVTCSPDAWTSSKSTPRRVYFSVSWTRLLPSLKTPRKVCTDQPLRIDFIRWILPQPPQFPSYKSQGDTGKSSRNTGQAMVF